MDAFLLFFIFPCSLFSLISFPFIVSMRSRIKRMQDIIEKNERVLKLLDDRKDK